MAQYPPPLRDIQFVLHELLDAVPTLKQIPAYADLDADIVNHILPAVRAAKNEVTPDQNLLTEAIKANAIQTRDIVLKDPLIAAEVSKGPPEVAAAYYDIDTGKFVVL